MAELMKVELTKEELQAIIKIMERAGVPSNQMRMFEALSDQSLIAAARSAYPKLRSAATSLVTRVERDLWPPPASPHENFVFGTDTLCYCATS